MDAVLAQDRGAARGHPDAGQRVAVHLVLLDHPLAFLMLKHIRGAAEDLPRGTGYKYETISFKREGVIT